MKTSTMWIIRIALIVQFLGVLAVPALVASAESPRGTWMAEWVNPSSEVDGRTIGVLKLRDGKLTFDEQVGQSGWEVELTSIRRAVVSGSSASTSLGAGKTVAIESATGEIYVVAIMEPNMTIGSPKRLLATIERALATMGVGAGASK